MNDILSQDAPSSTRRYRWLGHAGAAVLVLAALVVVLALRRGAEEERVREDVGARTAEIMNRIEAEAARIEREASRQDAEPANLQ
jgi:hypothetical protein